MMDASLCNAEIRFDTRGYNSNMSGIITEQQSNSYEKMQMQENGSSNNLDNETTFNEGMYAPYEIQELMPDLEIIAVDPNCFYASTEDDSDVDVEGDQNEYDEPIPLKSIPSDNIQIDNDSMDIITLNIDDNLLIDSPEEDYLFLTDRNDLQQFDLASYIVGESSSSFLLSPPPPALLKQRTPLISSSARQRLISMTDYTNAIPKNLIRFSTNQATVAVQKSPVAPVQRALIMPANNNRRKRKILTREFIYTSSSSDDDDDERQINNKSNNGGKTANNFPNENNNNSKKRNNNDNDPAWSPSTETDTKIKCKKKLTKQTDVKPNINTVDLKKSGKNMAQTQGGGSGGGGGLRQLLKHQLMSSRPTMKTKISKTNPPAGALNVDKTKTQKPPAKITGLGRGKDISITAKYYNCSESSDNCDRDTNHIVRNSIGTISESNGSDNDDMDCKSNDHPRKDDVQVERIYDAANSNKLMQLEHKPIATETKMNGSAPINSSSMDSCDFAKALKINAESVGTKPKPMKRKIDFEQQKRIIKSTILLQNPAKFKMISEMFPTGETKPCLTDVKMVNNSKNNTKITEKTEIVQTAEIKPEIIVKLEKLEKLIENDGKPQEADKNKEITKVAVDGKKVESNAKRKLNIEEYLRRNSLKRHEISQQNSSKVIENNSNNDMQKSDKNEIDNKTEQIEIPFENSMYEEIIIVSMGCNTDISIPAASFVKKSDIQNSKSINPSVLLSNIQTTVEKVNSTADTAIISSTSLISSIQDVILRKTCKKTLTENCKNKIKLENKEANDDNDDEEPEHGENKVIMHLLKDRIRPTTVTISIQTEPYFQFPPLEKFTSLAKKQMMSAGKRFGSIPKDIVANRVHNNNKGINHKNQKYRSKTTLSESSYYSDEYQSSNERRSRYSDFYDSNGEAKMRNYSHRKCDRLNRHRTISRSLSESSNASNSSTDSSSSSDSSSSGSSVSSAISSSKSFNSYGGSSSRSYYGDDNQFYRIRTKSNSSRRNRSRPQSNRSKSPEERRIVYVGRIEEETTKEDLRRQFSAYGTVKYVSIHYKEMNEWKYGFVTFERPSDAYRAIDDSKNNPQIQHYDISFGGRRAFCREKYFDLDNTGASYSDPIKVIPQKVKPKQDDSFDMLLRKMKEDLQDKRK